MYSQKNVDLCGGASGARTMHQQQCSSSGQLLACAAWAAVATAGQDEHRQGALLVCVCGGYCLFAGSTWSGQGEVVDIWTTADSTLRILLTDVAVVAL
jgi:hypothetical protein